MTLLSYEIFYTVAQEKSFQKAGKILNMTPSAISHAIASMEKELGFSLFIRSKNGTVLTSNGEAIYPQILEILNNNEYLLQSVAQLKGLQSGTIKVGCFNSVCTAWMPAIMTAFRERYPEITVKIFQGTYTDVEQWLKNGSIDVGFLSESCSKDFFYTTLYKDQLLCLTPKNFPVANPDYISIAELENQEFVFQREACDTDVQAFLDKYHISIKTIHHVIDDQSTVALIEAGMGIGIMPEILVKKMSSNINSYALYPAEYRTICLATTHSHIMSPAVNCFIKFVSNMDLKNLNS
ncbi:MAG: LysR family transcriptional regulator [Lachnospiraceae bacterium]|nr:LysR family transcriptional regulator [Lachnospiraceae bacterium]